MIGIEIYEGLSGTLLRITFHGHENAVFTHSTEIFSLSHITEATAFQ